VVYGYFLEICQRFGLRAGFSTSADIIGPGLCQSYWTFKNKKWVKTNNSCFSPLIFDKFSPINQGIRTRRQLLFSSPKVKPFNNPDLFNLFFDKQKTYNRLSKFSIPTITLEERTLKSINLACQKLTKLLGEHVGCNDFSSDFIMKDRFGAGGRHIHKFLPNQSAKMLTAVNRNTKVSYVIQPFAIFDKGFSYQNSPASTDIRLIYLKGKIVQSYIRQAKAGDFRCNEHQGGSLTYLSLNEIPKNLVIKSNQIAKILDKKCSLFTLDFIISNSGTPYLLEGNTGPGLDWNMDLPKNEYAAKKLIRLVVQELSTRANA